jgi:glycosyltransferase involved in cell wall biosynthesis
LGEAFARHGADLSTRAVFLPRLSHAEYLAVNLAADVFLDTPEWSGGNTTLEALACGLPVVTLPGTFLRWCHSVAMLRQFRMHECVAKDEGDYVAIATRLGNDPEHRRQIRSGGRYGRASEATRDGLSHRCSRASRKRHHSTIHRRLVRDEASKSTQVLDESGRDRTLEKYLWRHRRQDWRP